MYEINEDSFISTTEISDQHSEQDSVELTDERSSQNDGHRKTPLEKIIYSATIITTDTAYNSMSGAAYTVYIIQVKDFNSTMIDRKEKSSFSSVKRNHHLYLMILIVM